MSPDEIDLIMRAREGDQGAFTQLVQTYDARVMSLARSILGAGCDAEEVYQDVFLKVYRSLASFRFDSEFSTWLHRIVVNAALSRKRSLTRRFKHEQNLDGADDFFVSIPAHPADNPENKQLCGEIRQQIERALEQLPSRQHLVFVLKHDQGLKLKEIAKVLGIGEGTVKAYLFRAIEKLRGALGSYVQTHLT